MRFMGGQGPFRWRWGRMAGACMPAKSIPSISASPAGLLGRAPLIAMLGALVLRDLGRPDSLIRQFARKLLGARAMPRRTAVVVQPAGSSLLSSPSKGEGSQESSLSNTRETF